MDISKLNNKTMESREILFFYDARDSNPNGERETGMTGPRIDPETYKSIISDLSFKRIIRDYFLSKDQKSDKILVRRSFRYSESDRISMKDTFLKDIDNEETKLKNMNPTELYNSIKNKFIDHRIFGSIFYLKGELLATTGPIQFENTMSLNIPDLQEITISSTMASESGKGAGSLGRTKFVNYAIFPVHGIAKKSLSEISGASELDILKLFDAMWNGISSMITRTKNQQMARLLISLVMKDHRTQIPNVINSIQLKSNKVTNFKECVFDLNKFVDLISIFKNNIEKLEYREDPFIKYSYKGKTFQKLEEIKNFIDKCPKFHELDDLY